MCMYPFLGEIDASHIVRAGMNAVPATEVLSERLFRNSGVVPFGFPKRRLPGAGAHAKFPRMVYHTKEDNDLNNALTEPRYLAKHDRSASHR